MHSDASVNGLSDSSVNVLSDSSVNVLRDSAVNVLRDSSANVLSDSSVIVLSDSVLHAPSVADSKAGRQAKRAQEAASVLPRKAALSDNRLHCQTTYLPLPARAPTPASELRLLGRRWPHSAATRVSVFGRFW